MGFFDFSCCQPKTQKLTVPISDIALTAARILQILNESTPAGQTGSTTSVGNTFQTLTNITVVTAGTRVQLPDVDSPRGILVVAAESNTGSVYVGDSTVTKATGTKCGLQLVPTGMNSVQLTVSNASQVWVDADVSGSKLYVTVL